MVPAGDAQYSPHDQSEGPQPGDYGGDHRFYPAVPAGLPLPLPPYQQPQQDQYYDQDQYHQQDQQYQQSPHGQYYQQSPHGMQSMGSRDHLVLNSPSGSVHTPMGDQHVQVAWDSIANEETGAEADTGATDYVETGADQQHGH